jgi:D-ribose pyranase
MRDGLYNWSWRNVPFESSGDGQGERCFLAPAKDHARMKRGTLLHPELSRVIARLGHGDALVIADAGLPIPPGVERIDLAFAPGKPAFMDVLEAVLAEMQVERATLATEVKSAAPAFHERLQARLASLPKLVGLGVDFVSHEELKRLSRGAAAVVRTGEFTPYANVVLYSGVVF